ncbi:MAG TPA: site-specific integrase [Anaerolineae bacterium]|nr:site-specific integrase [Anaerolineae bacterium]HPL28305.1 site-specific integrase [Anaerolineae bacterium]
MRRSGGEGSIFQRRQDGRWVGAYQMDGRRHTVYGKTRSEVAEKLRAIQTQARQAGRLPDAGRLTVAEYLRQWLAQAEDRLRPTTKADYHVMAEKHINSRIGNTRLLRLDPLRLSRFYSTLAQDGMSARRRQMVHGFLHKALGDAHRWGLLPNNPATLVDVPKRERKELKLWAPGQVSAFLQAVQAGESGQYAYLLGFLLASGARIGEALGLRWSDVDLDAATVRIERQITEVHCRPIEQAPKTESGIRTIALPAWGVELLRRQKAQVNEWRLASGHAHDWPERVFTASVGSVPLRGNVKRALHALCDRFGLPRIRVHDLRHISLSLLAGAGVSVKDLQRRAGHSTPRMTLEVYTHVLSDNERQAAQLLDRLAR